MTVTQTRRTIHRQEQQSNEPDDGISINCVSTAKRNGHSRRIADSCQLSLSDGTGSVGCPDCPYSQQRTPRQ